MNTSHPNYPRPTPDNPNPEPARPPDPQRLQRQMSRSVFLLRRLIQLLRRNRFRSLPVRQLKFLSSHHPLQDQSAL